MILTTGNIKEVLLLSENTAVNRRFHIFAFRMNVGRL